MKNRMVRINKKNNKELRREVECNTQLAFLKNLLTV